MDRRHLLRLFAATGAGTALTIGSGSLKRAIADKNAPNWGYVGQTSPEHWSELSPSYSACQVGSDQSPINLHDAIKADLAEVKVDYQPIPLRILNTGRTIQVNAAPGNRIVLDGEEFELKQFHFHHPSEHTVDGTAFPMEAHFVHQNAKGEYAVLGVFLKEGAENTAFRSVWNALPKQQSNEQTVSGVQIDLNSLLPSDRNTYRYFGSLTTPPCSETVKWVIFEAPLELSAAQLTEFGEIFPLNARPVQSLKRRFLLRSN
jgi:carbonic anhydrase